VETSRGPIKTETVVNCTAGWASTIARMVDVTLPITTHQLQAYVTESLKPFFDKVVISATLHVFVTQTDRGEVVAGAEIDPYTCYNLRSTLPFLQQCAGHVVELFPCLKDVHVVRQWAGICDMTPDYSPIMGTMDGLVGFILDVGWGTYGFKAGPVSGKRIAELIATRRTPDLIKPFALSRFKTNVLVGEKAAAAVSH
jgi:sarcosine oxidase subunit beta